MTPFLDELAARAAHIMVNNLEPPPVSPHTTAATFHHPKKSGSRAAWRLHLDTSSLIAATDAHKNTQSLCCRGSSSETTRAVAIAPRREEERHTRGNSVANVTFEDVQPLFFFWATWATLSPCSSQALNRIFWHLLYYGWKEETHRPWMRLKIILPRLLAEIGFYPTQMSTL